MVVLTAVEVARKLALPLEHAEPLDPEMKELTRTEITFYKLGDPAYTMVAADGTRIDLGQSIEQFRRHLGGDHGFIEDPFGNQQPVRIPAAIKDGDRQQVAIVFHIRYKKGCSHPKVL